MWSKKLCRLYPIDTSSDNFSTLQLQKWEANIRLCIEEVGVDLELCVHAHGHDVDPIMEASCNNNDFLDNYHLVSVNWSFATVVPTMIVLLWSHFSDKLKHFSSTDQYVCPTSIMIYLRVLPLVSRGYHAIALHLMKLLMKYYLSLSLSLHGCWVFCHLRTPISESILHSDSITLK